MRISSHTHTKKKDNTCHEVSTIYGVSGSAIPAVNCAAGSAPAAPLSWTRTNPARASRHNEHRHAWISASARRRSSIPCLAASATVLRAPRSPLPRLEFAGRGRGHLQGAQEWAEAAAELTWSFLLISWFNDDPKGGVTEVKNVGTSKPFYDYKTLLQLNRDGSYRVSLNGEVRCFVNDYIARVAWRPEIEPSQKLERGSDDVQRNIWADGDNESGTKSDRDWPLGPMTSWSLLNQWRDEASNRWLFVKWYRTHGGGRRRALASPFGLCAGNDNCAWVWKRSKCPNNRTS
jgi:hypothetical protein